MAAKKKDAQETRVQMLVDDMLSQVEMAYDLLADVAGRYRDDGDPGLLPPLHEANNMDWKPDLDYYVQEAASAIEAVAGALLVELRRRRIPFKLLVDALWQFEEVIRRQWVGRIGCPGTAELADWASYCGYYLLQKSVSYEGFRREEHDWFDRATFYEVELRRVVRLRFSLVLATFCTYEDSLKASRE
jgi:hypothetical protein